MNRRGAVFFGLALAAGLASGCHTPAGCYFVNRARDLGECVRVELGATGIGCGVSLAGVAHVGLGLHGNFAVVGWDYGLPVGDLATDWVPTRIHGNLGWVHGDTGPGVPGRAAHQCFVAAPAILSWGGNTWGKGWNQTPLWDPVRDPWHRWSRVHAFDIEATLGFGLTLTIGFSPGEFLDFLLGWLGLDIAGDDHPWNPPPE